MSLAPPVAPSHAPSRHAAEDAARPRNVADLLAAGRRVCAAVAADASRRDREREVPHDAFDLIRRERLGSGRVPRAYGGIEIPYVDLVGLFIGLARADSSIAQALIPHHTTVERLRVLGNEAQRRHFYRQMLDGAIVGGAAAERGGQYRTDITTRLTRHGTRFLLNGAKAYSTGSLMSDLLRISALDDAGRMVSVIVPSDRQGIHLLDDWRGMGQRATASGSTILENVDVDESEVIPFVQGESQARSYSTAGTQLLHATIEVGIARAALADATAWARGGARPVRESGVARAADDPFVQHAVGAIAAHAGAAEALCLSAAAAVDRAATASFAGAPDDPAIEPLAVEASIAVAQAKIIATEAGLKAGELLYEVGGASTTLEDLNFDRHWRNARTHTTHDPVAYKFKVVGDYLLNGTPPPVSLYY